jgi:hypothetical protein
MCKLVNDFTHKVGNWLICSIQTVLRDLISKSGNPTKFDCNFN